MCRRTNYADLPYNVKINLLTLLLRQHIIVGHRELERFVKAIKSEVNMATSQHNWEKNLLDRLEQMVVPMSPLTTETKKLTCAVHLSDNAVELIKKEWCNDQSKEMSGVYNTTYPSRCRV